MPLGRATHDNACRHQAAPNTKTVTRFPITKIGFGRNESPIWWVSAIRTAQNPRNTIAKARAAPTHPNVLCS